MPKIWQTRTGNMVKLQGEGRDSIFMFGGQAMDKSFPEIKTFFGFGCMRLPMKGTEVDIEQFKEMTDYFIENGFNYFDTAHGYIDGKSELAIKEALTSRYSRDKYLLTNKLTEPYFNKEEDIRPFFQSQLDACGVEYFDFYLMHAQNATNFKKFKTILFYFRSIPTFIIIHLIISS